MEILIFLDQRGNDEFFTTVSGLNFDMGGGGDHWKNSARDFCDLKIPRFFEKFFYQGFLRNFVKEFLEFLAITWNCL